MDLIFALFIAFVCIVYIGRRVVARGASPRRRRVENLPALDGVAKPDTTAE
jgi:hypothetical protein